MWELCLRSTAATREQAAAPWKPPQPTHPPAAIYAALPSARCSAASAAASISTAAEAARPTDSEP